MAKPLGTFSAATSDAATVTTSALSIVQSADQNAVVTKAAAAKLTSRKGKTVPAFFHPNDLLQRQLALQALTTHRINKIADDVQKVARYAAVFDQITAIAAKLLI